MLIILFLILIILFPLFIWAKRNDKEWSAKIPILMGLLVAVFVIFFVISDLNQRGNYDKSDVTLKENENIDVKILDVNKEQIQIQINNNDSVAFRYTDYFLCMKKEKGKWNYIKFRPYVRFSKGIYELEPGQSKTRIIQWKDYFGHKLKQGEYRLLWIDQLEFTIPQN